MADSALKTLTPDSPQGCRQGIQDDAQSLLRGLRADGYTLRLNGEKLLVSPLSTLTPERLQALKIHREAIRGLLLEEAAWERRTDALARFVPDFEDGKHCQLAEVVIVRWFDDDGELIHEAVVPKEEDDALCAWIKSQKESKRNETKEPRGKRKQTADL